MNRVELEQQSSLLYWYPKIEGKVPTPATKILPLSVNDYNQLQEMLNGGDLSASLHRKIVKMTSSMEVPFFLRTDQASGKHSWVRTCYVADRKEIFNHIVNLVEWHACAGIMGLSFDALIFREYLPLQSQFTAFQGMPIAPEWRWFVKDGSVTCKHFYWPDDSIERPSREDWQPILHSMQFCKPEEDRLLNRYATIFAENLPGYWSVDFALTLNRGWVLIDAARGEISWHPPCDQRVNV